jgi:hypothetical protein
LGPDPQNPSDLTQAFFHPYRPKTANVLWIKSDSIVMYAKHQPVKILFQFDMDRFGLSVARDVLECFLRDPVEADAEIFGQIVRLGPGRNLHGKSCSPRNFARLPLDRGG